MQVALLTVFNYRQHLQLFGTSQNVLRASANCELIIAEASEVDGQIKVMEILKEGKNLVLRFQQPVGTPQETEEVEVLVEGLLKDIPYHDLCKVAERLQSEMVGSQGSFIHIEGDVSNVQMGDNQVSFTPPLTFVIRVDVAGRAESW